MKNILITGGAGFIGSNFVRHILKVEPKTKVINLDALTYAGSLENLKNLPNSKNHSFVKGNILDGELVIQLLRENKIDTIVHFAAESHVDRSISGPGEFIKTNINGTFTLLEAAREYWLNENKESPKNVRFHHISTDEVFGTLESEEAAWTELSPYAPNSPYAASKASSNHLVRAYGHTYGLPFTLTNCTNNYGPYQFPEKLIPLIILNALEGKPLPVYGDGQQVRDWLHVKDHCEAIYSVLKNGKNGNSYNIGGGNQPTNLSIVQMICDVLDELEPNLKIGTRRELISFVKDRPGHDRRYAMNFGKITRELGWKPSYNLMDGLKETVKWYLPNDEWIEVIRKQQEFTSWIDKNYSNREEE
jgi:dTDP-glucose 4,6-dehydratase